MPTEKAVTLPGPMTLNLFLSTTAEDKQIEDNNSGRKTFVLMDGDSYLHQDVLCILVQPARVEGVIHTDGLKKLLFILPMERGLANEHLIQKDTKGPPVNRGVVLLPQQYLSTKRSNKGRSKMSDTSFSTSDGWPDHGLAKAALQSGIAEALPSACSRSQKSASGEGPVAPGAMRHSHTWVPKQSLALQTACNS